MLHLKRLLPLLILFCSVSTIDASSPLSEFQIEDLIENGIDVNLKNPTYSDGVFSTCEGGVISGSKFRIQARTICYTKKKIEGVRTEIIEAEGDMIVEFSDYIFIGDRIEYDVLSDCGVIYNARTAIEPWFFGGARIELCADKSVVIHDGFITTSENRDSDWKIHADRTRLCDRKYLTAKNVKFEVARVPILWMPSFTTNLDSIFESPLQYMVRWGGSQGPRAKVIYELFSWNRFTTFARLEYRLNRGPGGGVETYYDSEDHKHSLQTLNYIARDSAVELPNERFRYRFQGVYSSLFNEDKTQVYLCYDKLSDQYMAEDYSDDTLDIQEAGLTELLIRHQEPTWISNFVTRIQANNFQTVKQELPSLSWRSHPFTIGSTGIISDTFCSGGYIDYDYASDLRNVHDYNSTRFELMQKLYRSFQYGNITTTPEAGFVTIYYGNSPENDARTVVAGLFEVNANTHIYKCYNNVKHVVEPYVDYRYYTFPGSYPSKHFIFDIDDGWYRINTLKFGVDNNFFIKDVCNDSIYRLVSFDLYANAFFDTETIKTSVPRGYLDIKINSYRNVRQYIDTVWNFQEGQLDLFSFRTEWTATEDIAVAFEYRHRGPYWWRKVDFDNFIIDSYRPVDELLFSSMSDRSDTVLLHTFVRFHPNWAIELQARHGWNRLQEPQYTEYQIDIHTNLGSKWNLKLSYQFKEEDHRIALYFSLGAKRPNQTDCCAPPYIDF